MAEHFDASIADALDRFWNALVSGNRDAIEAAARRLDPDSEATIRALHDLATQAAGEPAAPQIDDRVWAEITRLERAGRGDKEVPMNGRLAHEWHAPSHGLGSVPGQRDSTAQREGRPVVPGLAPPAARGRALASLAVGAALLAAVGVGLARVGPEEPPDALPRLPALAASPAAEETAADTGRELLASGFFPKDTLPAAPVNSHFYRFTMPPGGSVDHLVGPFCGCGAEWIADGVGMEWVESGEYGVTLDAPFRVSRGGVEEEIPAGQQARLGPGDAAIYPHYAAAGEIANVGQEPLVVVGGVAVSQTFSATPAPSIPDGMDRGELAVAYPAEWDRIAGGDVEFSLERMVVPAGESLPPYEPGGIQALHVMSGSLKTNTLRPGEQVPSFKPLFYDAGQTTAMRVTTPGNRRTMASDGEEDAVLLVLTIRPR